MIGKVDFCDRLFHDSTMGAAVRLKVRLNRNPKG
jgi:hypothetical protein